MHQRTTRVSTLDRPCALFLIVATLACGSEDPDPAQSGPAESAAPPAAVPSQAPNGTAPSGNGNMGNAPSAPVDTGSTPNLGTPGTSANEQITPTELTPPTSDDTRSEGGGTEGDDTEGTPNPPSAPAIPTVPVGGGACPAADGLLAMLESFAPADAELAEDFAGYLGAEVGPLSCATSGTGGPRTINQTIVVPPNTIYDGNGEVLTADATAMNCDLTAGEQAESQRPYFLLAPGASLRNVTINYPGCEGVHMMGNNILENITWVDVGEDAASVRSYFEVDPVF